MLKSKKQMYIVIGAFIAILALFTTTYAFFNYTRTGSSNVIKVGRISFNSEQGNSINLTNVFPIDKANLNTDTDNVGSVAIHITGDTTYTEGIEYLVTASNVSNSVGNKKIPLSVDVSYEASNNKSIGTSDNNYFDNRGGNTSLYKVLAGKTVNEGNKLVVGYIKPDQVGIDGTITIKAFIDKDKIAITDTYSTQEDNELGYIINENVQESDITSCTTFFSNYGPPLESGETYEDFCRGTGTISGMSLDYLIAHGYLIDTLLQMNIIVQKNWVDGTTSEWVNGRTILTTQEWNSLQANGVSFQVKVEANEGVWVNPTGNAMNTFSTEVYSSNIVQNIKEIYFNNMSENEMHQRYANATIKADLTYNDEGEVLSWLETDTNDNTKYIMYVASDGETFLTTGHELFSNINYAEKIEFNNVNTSRVTDMMDMFYHQENLLSLDLRSFDTSNVTNLYAFVYNCPKIENVNIAGLDLRKAYNMMSMFSYNSNLQSVDLTGVQTRDVVTMINFFYGSNKIQNINLDGLGGDNLREVNGIIGSSSNVENISMKNFNFGKSTNVNGVFSNLFKVQTIDLSNANFNEVTDISNLFYGSYNLVTVDLSNANTSNIVNMSSMFQNCSKLVNLNLDGVDTSSVTNMNSMFDGASSLITLDLSSFDVSNITPNYESNMFNGCSSLNTIYVSNIWDMSGYSSSVSMFTDCTSLVGGNGTTYDSIKVDKTMAVIDNNDHEGYLTLKTN